MSVFTNTQTTSDETTKDTDQSNQEDFVSKVVAEKGEQWSDPKVLAKGYISAQEYISELERQTKELREDLDKQDYAKTLLEQLQEKGKPRAEENPGAKGDTEKGNTNPAFSEDELKNLVKDVVGSMSAEERRKENLKKVDSKLTELFGTDASAEVDKRAKELGISKDKMAELASDSPEAFIRLMGEAAKKETNTIPSSSVNTSSLNTNSNERDWRYYQNLRRENPSLYRSIPIQKQMLSDKKRLGEKFGN